jgi:methionyl-tRNA synthetase
MVEKYFDGKVPEQGVGAPGHTAGEALNAKVHGLSGELEKTIPNFDFIGALTKIWEVIGIANKYIEDSKPWALAKEKRTDELAGMMRNLLGALKTVALAIDPFMPSTSKEMLSQLAKDKLGKSTPLFPRIE